MGHNGRTGNILAIAAIAVALICGFLWRNDTIDDAYIVYQYAKNIAAGHGAVFNIGERVEGYSSPFWVAVLSLVTALGLNPVVLSCIILYSAQAVTERSRASPVCG
jgi:arabinofuranosyltransferase